LTYLRWKLALLDLAAMVDEFRLFPRIFLFGYGALAWKSCLWYMSLPAPSTEQTAFVTLLSTVFAPMTNWYMQTGKKRDT